MLLHKLGYRTVAVTGKSDAEAYLRDLGAEEVIDRKDLTEPTAKGLLSERWGGAIDTVGGDILMNVLKSIKYGGSVACCGLAASPNFQGCVYPFILRGINLLGVDSAQLPRDYRELIWARLAADWRLPNLEAVVRKVSLDGLMDAVAKMQQGSLTGRVVVDVNA
jgi:putative YhdH/YhfP family quinone oxidoreductase